jgi:hypothetical protein
MRVHWIWVGVGFAAGAVLWPMVSSKIGAGASRSRGS